MRRHMPRKVTPRVRGGRVQRKSRCDVAGCRAGPARIRVEPAGPGCRHVVNEADVRRFLELLPDREALIAGLEEIVLTDHDPGADGRYGDGVVTLFAWTDPPHPLVSQLYYEEHREVLELLRVRVGPATWAHEGTFRDHPRRWFERFERIEERGPGVRIGLERDVWGRLIETCELRDRPDGVDVYERCFPCRFTRGQARAFTLLHVFLHELGHHRDAMRPPARGWCVRGEEYAEHFALRRGSELLERYVAAFGL